MPTFDDGVVSAPGTLVPAPVYLSVDDADAYFDTRLDSDAWTEATRQQKTAALVTATRAIDLLRFVGVKAVASQPCQFPRRNALGTGPAAVPPDILVACCEEAIVRLDGIDMELETDGLAVMVTTYAGVKEAYDRTTVVENIRAGIASGVAWNYLVPWLADPLTLYLTRS